MKAMNLASEYSKKTKKRKGNTNKNSPPTPALPSFF